MDCHNPRKWQDSGLRDTSWGAKEVLILWPPLNVPKRQVLGGHADTVGGKVSFKRPTSEADFLKVTRKLS